MDCLLQGIYFHDNLKVCVIVNMQLKPNFCDAWSNLASAYMRKGRLQEAAECCRHALMLNPRLVSFLCLCKIVSRIILKNGCGPVPVHE
jgi:tetratricopeptide (TPR) repeat protein